MAEYRNRNGNENGNGKKHILYSHSYNNDPEGSNRIVLSMESFPGILMCGSEWSSGKGYPNAGVWLGPAGLLRDVFRGLQRMGKEYSLRDRVSCALMRGGHNWRDVFSLDEDSNVFQTAYDISATVPRWLVSAPGGHSLVFSTPPFCFYFVGL